MLCVSDWIFSVKHAGDLFKGFFSTETRRRVIVAETTASVFHYKSEVGGENRGEAEVPYRESKPSAHAHATHDTTDQSGAISSGG